MPAPTFGWVITPSARNAETLLDSNRRFIERVRGLFETIWVEDHFQWGKQPLLECWTSMAYLAAQHPEFKIGALVLGQSYRNPALTAKMMATLHWLTGGRMIAGIGAGWKKDEYRSYGWPFPDAQTRIEQLEDAVNIIRAMWTQSPASYTGKHYSIKDAYCEPRPDPPPPLLIAGGGEKLTLRVVAKHAEWMNIPFVTAEIFARKLDALKRHCDDVKRDYDAIKKTYYGFANISRKGKRRERQDDMHIVQGTPDQVAADLRQFVDLGVEHFILRFTDFPKIDGLELFLDEVKPNLAL